MIATRLATFAAIAITVGAFAAGARLALRSPLEATNMTVVTVGAGERVAAVPPLRTDSLAEAATRRDPFRLARSAAPEQFSAATPPVAYAAPRPPRPQLVLVGVVLGRESAALIDGLPSLEGSRVMRLGERVGDYVLRAVASDHVVIAGPDTTWTLRVRSQFP